MSTTTHGACGKRWTGFRTSHCAVCCATFAGDSVADRHRVGDHALPKGADDARRCLNPGEMRAAGMAEDDAGLWYVPEWRAKARRTWVTGPSACTEGADGSKDGRAA